MKLTSLILIVQFGTMQINAQTIAINKTTTFSYDLNGNITSRKGITIPSLKPNDGNNRIDISGDISIIGKDNKFTIDLKKDYVRTRLLYRYGIRSRRCSLEWRDVRQTVGCRTYCCQCRTRRDCIRTRWRKICKWCYDGGLCDDV